MARELRVKEDIRAKSRRLSSRTIVVLKIAAGSLLFFGCCLFFFSYRGMFWDDIKGGNPFPVVFFSGLILVCAYIINLVGHMDSEELYLADRFDLVYKIVFTITILSMALRAILSEPYLNVPVTIMVVCIFSGILTLVTPKIVDNNNDEF